MNKYDIAIIGCGYVGSSLAKHFSKKYSVRTFDVKEQPKELEGLNIPHKVCDIRDYGQLFDSLQNPVVVIHTAIIQIPLIDQEKELAYEVNILGTQNVCKFVSENPVTKGMILSGSWHVFGEQGMEGNIDEGFGYRPDKVEDRAKLYTIAKTIQECLVRFYDQKSDKTFGVIRMGTVLGHGMPEKTAANIFITKGLKSEDITPYKNSMHRPMFYISINDLHKAFEAFSEKIMNGERPENHDNIFNLVYPEPVSIIDLANMVRESVINHTKGKANPKVSVVDNGLPSLFSEDDKNKVKFDIRRAKDFLKILELESPKEAIDRLVSDKVKSSQ